MNWHAFISTLLGGFITFCAILFTNVLDLRKRKRTHDALIHALLQGLQDEIGGLLEMAETSPVRPIQAVTEGKPYEGLFTASQDYFIVYHANAALVMQIADAELRRSIMQTYTRAKAVLDTVNMNRLYLSVTTICKAPSSKPKTIWFTQNPRTIAERWSRSPGSSSRPMRSSGERQPACWKCSHARSGPN